MREHPILFNGAMVRAILAGKKTQTRRVIKGIPWRPGCNPDFSQARAFCNAGEFRIAGSQEMTTGFRFPLGQPGDRLWVRETTVNVEKHGYLGPVHLESEEGYATLQGGLAPAPDDMTEVEPHEITLRPSIHMLRSMCRLFLEITDIRVERLQAISPADALAEGAMEWAGEQETPIRDLDPGDERIAFSALWDSTGGDWSSNPWVWAITFKRIDA
ncbi:hypothetical protein D7U98_05760 [Stenotrophomonas maltophilia]|uniref:hypothetical protein n=1 Tax=Stenotrophomonas maltophilia TaxID=40324 RepID=UPI0013125996|nr:hypothetical protein [Stenotrophomonas maltophilia]MBA0394910.1 hypothetical protein [Stenotrophomonas maltophilia]